MPGDASAPRWRLLRSRRRGNVLLLGHARVRPLRSCRWLCRWLVSGLVGVAQVLDDSGIGSWLSWRNLGRCRLAGMTVAHLVVAQPMMTSPTISTTKPGSALAAQAMRSCTPSWLRSA